MKYILLIYLLSLINTAPILTDTKASITQSVYETDTDLYIYTYSDTDNDVYKLYRFTTEEVITCFVNESSNDGNDQVYINLVLVSFSVQFDYLATDTDEINTCNDFSNQGIFNSTNFNQRMFHNNMLDYNRFLENFQKNIIESYDDAYTFDDSQLQADHDLIANEIFLDQTQTLNENLDINQYHILSSHNTYLEDTEYFGQSVSERAIVRALYLGFRNIELDLWPQDQPNGSAFNVYISIQHKFGVLETNKIDLKSVMQVIQDYGFLIIDSPIIVNFENHLFTVNEYKYFIKAMEETSINFLMAEDLNNINVYKYSNLKNIVIIRMNFSDDDKNLTVEPEVQDIDNESLDDLYKNQYIENPLLQFITGFSFLTNMTQHIYSFTQSELQNIINNDDLNTTTLTQNQHQKKIKQKSEQFREESSMITNRGVTSFSGNYYDSNEALKYISMTRDCYTDVNNIIWFSFAENLKYKNTKKEIENINNNSSCQSMIRIYTGFFRNLSGNFKPLIPMSLGVNMVALNSQNIDRDLIDYMNFFTTRNGYRELLSSTVSAQKKYIFQIEEIYIPKKQSAMVMGIYYYRSQKNYRKQKKIGRRLLRFNDGRNIRTMKDYKFKASDEDFLFINIGFQYRYSVMMKDVFVSGQSEVDNDDYQIVILRKRKNFYWDGAFMKVRILDDS